MSTDLVVRSAAAPDQPALVEIARGSELFQPEEIPWLESQMTDFFRGELPTHRWTVVAHGDTIAAAAYLAPEDSGPGVYNLLFIGVLPGHRRRGAASLLLRDVEHHLRAQGARMLLIDTSSTEPLAPARAFYTQHGYDLEARIRDYWGPGDDKVTFRRVL